MGEELNPKIENLEQRLRLLRELADSLAQAQAAVLRSDLECLRKLTSRQREVCGQYRELACSQRHAPGEPDQASERASSNPESADTKQRWEALTAEIARMERKTLELNRAYRALLRRARRTVDIFCRALASSSITYEPPQPVAPFACCCEEVERV